MITAAHIHSVQTILEHHLYIPDVDHSFIAMDHSEKPVINYWSLSVVINKITNSIIVV